MPITSQEIMQLVDRSMTTTVLENEHLRAMNDGLTAKQKNFIVSKIAERVAEIYNAQKFMALATADEAIPVIKSMIELVTLKSLNEINQQLISLTNLAVKNHRHFDTMSVFDNWIKNAEKLNQITFDQSLAAINLSADETYPLVYQFGRNYLRAEVENYYAELKPTDTFPNLAAAVEDLNDDAEEIEILARQFQNIRNFDERIEAIEKIKKGPIRKYILDKTAQLLHTLVEPYIDLLTTKQARTLMDTTKEMLLSYVLEDIGHDNLLHYKDKDAALRDEKINKLLMTNADHMKKFIKVHVSTILSLDSLETDKVNQQNADEATNAILESISELTALTGDTLSNAPGVHHTIPLTAAQELSHISKVGGATYVIASGLSALSLPMEYTLAKLRGQKTPEVNLQKGVQTTAKMVGSGLAIAALCEPHAAATLTVISALVAAIVAAGNTAHFFYEKSKLPGLIKEIETRIEEIKISLMYIKNQQAGLQSISQQINEGTLFSRDDMDKYLKAVMRVQDHLADTMRKLKNETINLAEMIAKFEKEFSFMATADSTTSGATSTVYLAGAALQLVPVLNVAGNALMITSDVCSIGYAASAKLVEVNKSLSQTSSGLFSHPAGQTAANPNVSKPSEGKSGPRHS